MICLSCSVLLQFVYINRFPFIQGNVVFHVKVHFQPLALGGKPKYSLSRQQVIFGDKATAPVGAAAPGRLLQPSFLSAAAGLQSRQPTAIEIGEKKVLGRARLISPGSCLRVGSGDPGRTSATVTVRRLHVEVFGSGLSELRAQLAPTDAHLRVHANTCARARTHARRAVAWFAPTRVIPG